MLLEVALLTTALHAGLLRPPLPRGVRCRAPLAIAEDTPAGLSDEPQTVQFAAGALQNLVNTLQQLRPGLLHRLRARGR